MSNQSKLYIEVTTDQFKAMSTLMPWLTVVNQLPQKTKKVSVSKLQLQQRAEAAINKRYHQK